MAMALDTERWEIEDLDQLPDDGNTYEVIRGELFVTPAPTRDHEVIASRLTALLLPYVVRHQIGAIFHPRSTLRFEGSQVEPDLMVQDDDPGFTWDTVPPPVLVVEIASPSTRQRDYRQKRGLYMDAGVGEYWIVDLETRTVRAIRGDGHDVAVTGRIVWTAPGASESLAIEIAEIFGRR